MSALRDLRDQESLVTQRGVATVTERASPPAGCSMAVDGNEETPICSILETRRRRERGFNTVLSFIYASIDVALSQQSWEVLKQAIAASRHWRIIRRGATQHL